MSIQSKISGSDQLKEIAFSGQLRPSQTQAINIIRKDIHDGGRRLHIVAPPGSGKTILGLYIWAELIRKPVLVLSPNTAIQQQWISKLGLFGVSGAQPGISCDPEKPGIFTSLTYQSVTMPSRGDKSLEASARNMWTEKLMIDGEVQDETGAAAWIDDLMIRNREYYEERIAGYRKKARDELSLSEDSLSILHSSCINTIHRLRDKGIGLIIFDECHHLMGYWGRVLTDAHELLGDPIILGLTATPPDEDSKNPEDVERYKEFFGPVDYEVPVPALVKENNLAPYQDLAYFVRPVRNELEYIADSDQEFYTIVDELCENSHNTDRAPPMTFWVNSVLKDLQLPGGGCTGLASV